MTLWLVTGGCGFIGSHLADALLQRGDRVRVLDDLSTGKRQNLASEAELLVGDVADEAAVAVALDGADGCFHLAAVSSVQRCTEDWLGTHRTNLQGTITIFEKARRTRPGTGLPVVYASSAAVYGDNSEMPLNESSATKPLSGYGADKLGCELHAKVAWRVHGVPNIGLRFFNVYGPRQDPSSPYSGVIAIFADRIARQREIEIFGDGGQIRDFVYVGDVVNSMIAAMIQTHTEARVFNVCTGQGTSLLDLADFIGSVAGQRPMIRHGAPRVGDIRISIGDPSAGAQALGLRPRIGMLEGLRHTLAASTCPLPARTGTLRSPENQAPESQAPESQAQD